MDLGKQENKRVSMKAVSDEDVKSVVHLKDPCNRILRVPKLKISTPKSNKSLCETPKSSRKSTLKTPLSERRVRGNSKRQNTPSGTPLEPIMLSSDEEYPTSVQKNPTSSEKTAKHNSETDSDDVFRPSVMKTPKTQLGVITPRTSERTSVRKSLRFIDLNGTEDKGKNLKQLPQTPSKVDTPSSSRKRGKPSLCTNMKESIQLTPTSEVKRRARPSIANRVESILKTPTSDLKNKRRSSVSTRRKESSLETPKSSKKQSVLENTPRSATSYKLRTNLKKTDRFGFFEEDLFSDEDKSMELSDIEELEDSDGPNYGDTDENTDPDENSDEDLEEVSAKKHKLLSGKTPAKRVLFTGKNKTESGYLTCSTNSDGYFLGKGKCKTSKNTISSLQAPSFSEAELKNIMRTQYAKHATELKELTEKYASDFSNWFRYLNHGFNLLLHGLGSKMDLLKRFHKELLQDYPVVVVNGFFPGLKINEILSVILNDILDLENCPVNVNVALNIIETKLKEDNDPIFMIVHNIDGVGLRGSKNQAILSKLASLPKVHMIASVDHINASLQWSNHTLTSFNFLWMEVPTYRPYLEETSYENSLKIEQLGFDAELSTLNSAFNAVDAKSREVLGIIIENNLENRNNKKFRGILLGDLFTLCKKNSNFLGLNKYTLKAHLGKFVNYGLVKIMNNYVCVQVNKNILLKFYNQRFKSGKNFQ